ncbi:MAG: GNAT family N-acetyltransferase [Alphaproteobacteria bacterium]|nr:GNAT family N-acetyltransferase [Alphaproteobacteria bacterium]
MNISTWREEPISKKHDRKDFDCGQNDLNIFLAQYARQSHELGASKTYVAIDSTDGTTIYGFYTLSPAQVDFSKIPPSIPSVGRYPMGCFRLGRLAVRKNLQGQGLGGQLLMSAAQRCIRASQEVGGTALLIDAKDKDVAEWYKSYGALPLPEAPLSLLLPYSTILEAFKKAGKKIQ